MYPVGGERACAHCTMRNPHGARFCERCGRKLIDDATRYLCAAAHLDATFADATIAELLIEPVRAIPPSPGVDAAAVLREAVAARYRRRLRDWALLTLFVVAMILSFTTVLIWIVVAVVAAVVMAAAPGRRRPDRPIVVGLAGLVLAPVVLSPLVVPYLSAGYVPDLDIVLSSEAMGERWPVYLVALALLLVLVADELTVNHLVATCFRPDRFEPDVDRLGSGWQRTARTMGVASHRTAIDDVAQADARVLLTPEAADVVVHRDYSPFVGAGEIVSPNLIAMRLEPAGDRDDEPDRPAGLGVLDLHDHITAAVAGLCSASSLGPDARLGGLTMREQLLVSAERMIRGFLDAGRQSPVLGSLRERPAAAVSPMLARDLAERPQEGMRYYRCSRVEAWDRNLVISCFVHLGTDQRMLYLERTFCVLTPVRRRYQRIDWDPDRTVESMGRALAQLILLPTSLPRRIRQAVHWFAPVAERTGTVVPARYGASRSLREMGADDDVQSYLQGVDVERYVRIIDATITRAVGDFLERRGYSVVDFMRMAAAGPTINTFNVQGSVIGSAMGSGNSVRADGARAATARAGAARPTTGGTS